MRTRTAFAATALAAAALLGSTGAAFAEPIPPSDARVEPQQGQQPQPHQQGQQPQPHQQPQDEQPQEQGQSSLGSIADAAIAAALGG